MIHAYNEIYVEDARNTLGEMFDYAINDLKYDLSYFWILFLVSSISKRFEEGDPSIVVGRSGIELCYDILDKYIDTKQGLRFSKTKEYWLGYFLAYYQWYRNLSFYDIAQKIDINDILDLYYPYHEMDIMQFCDKMDEIIYKDKINKLKQARLNAGYSQKELANMTNISLRTIQQYEQGQKNINAAKAESVYLLAKALFVEEKDILEL